MSIFRPVTIITGASSGIGAALAWVFAQHDHEVVLVARREAQLEALASDIAASGKMRPHVIAIDLGRSDSPARISHELLAREIEPAIVVNNAGFGLLGNAAELDRAEQLAMIDLNVRVLTELSLRWTNSVVRHHGGILNVASVAGFLPGPGMAIYYATKAYVLSFSEALHSELKPKGVRVSALCPGPVITEFQDRAGIPEGQFSKLLLCSAERVAREGYDGFMKGHRLIVPGFGNKLASFLPRLLPRGLILSIVQASQSGRSKARPTRSWPRRRSTPPS